MIHEATSGDRTVYTLCASGKEKGYRLYDFEFRVAELFDGRNTVEKIAVAVQKKIGIKTEAIDIDRFAQQLIESGLVERVTR